MTTKGTVTMIDYGIGNTRSVQKALAFVGGQVQLSADPDTIARADRLVLPGVGAFGATMQALRDREQVAAIHAAVAAGTPLLGICVGMQVLFDDSDELGFHTGLGLIGGQVRRFSADNGLKIPHMGWNQLEHATSDPLLRAVARGDYAYFVHSYYCRPRESADIVATSGYGQPFCAITRRDHVMGFQFHAEKSRHVGLQLLRNFLTL
jgi:glutamine amidotransferase